MAKNFKTVGQGKLSKACDRLGMIASEFFEKGRFYSWRLAVYNTAWWMGNYCHPLVRLQFWAARRLFDGVAENNTGRNDLHFLLNTAWDEEKYRRLSEANWTFKLSYKSVWRERTSDGKPTFYGVLFGESNEHRNIDGI